MGIPTGETDSATDSTRAEFLVTTPLTNLPERNYVLSVVLSDWFGINFDLRAEAGRCTTTIQHKSGGPHVSLAEDVLLKPLDQHNPWLTGSVTWVPHGTVVDPNKIVSFEGFPVFSGSSDGPISSRVDSGVSIRGDLLGTTFALLSGFEESFIPKDEHGRARYADTRLGKADLITHPVVDELAELLWSAIVSLWPRTKGPSRKPKISPTHDIDRLWAYGGGSRTASIAAGVLAGRHKGRAAAMSTARTARSTARAGLDTDPFFSFAKLMDSAEQHGRTSSFYFIPGSTFKARAPLGYYRIGDDRLKALFQSITKRGHTIGIHPSYSAHLNQPQLCKEVDGIRNAATSAGISLDPLGGRHHYLRWDSSASPLLWENAGLHYDSSVGHSDAAGFRAGTSRPYHLWEAGQQRKTTVLERPLILMDATVSTNMGLSGDDPTALAMVELLKRRCRQFDGDFVFLVHNCRLEDDGMSEFYQTCLR